MKQRNMDPAVFALALYSPFCLVNLARWARRM